VTKGSNKVRGCVPQGDLVLVNCSVYIVFDYGRVFYFPLLEGLGFSLLQMCLIEENNKILHLTMFSLEIPICISLVFIKYFVFIPVRHQ